MRNPCSNPLSLQGKLPTGLIAAGPDSDPSMYFAAVAGRLDSKEPTIFVQLSSEQCPNLKATLKYINQSATRQMGEDVEDSMTSGGKVIRCHVDVVNRLLTTYSITDTRTTI